MVGKGRIEKTEKEYKGLGYVLRRARRARLIPFESISDSGSMLPIGLTGWSKPADLGTLLRAIAQNFDLDQQLGQKRRVAVWCEAQGMVAQLKRVADPYGVHVVSGGGFDSVTDKHGFAKLVITAAQPFDVLHIGDLDQAGESIFTVVSEDVPAFAGAMRGDVTFTRLAITEEQVKLYDLPHVPGEKPIVQAEAYARHPGRACPHRDRSAPGPEEDGSRGAADEEAPGGHGDGAARGGAGPGHIERRRAATSRTTGAGCGSPFLSGVALAPMAVHSSVGPSGLGPLFLYVIRAAWPPFLLAGGRPSSGSVPPPFGRRGSGLNPEQNASIA